MLDRNPEIEPRSFEEIALSLNNNLLREFSLRITACKEEADWRAKLGAGKLLLCTPLAFTGIVVGLSTRMLIAQGYEMPSPLVAEVSSWVSLVSGFVGLFSIPSGAADLNASAQARGEANSLTTVLASYLIAEQTK